MRILVTGATGFLGHAFAEHLLSGAAVSEVSVVRVTGRNRAAAEDLARAGAELVTGDVTDPTFAAAAVDGIDAVMHCAGRSGLGGPMRLYRANVEGTRVLLEAARAAGVSRFVHIGTPSMYFDFSDRLDRDEDDIPDRLPDNYALSKLEADRLVLAANEASFLTMSLRPRFTTGRGETNVFFRFIRMHKAGKLRRIGRGDNLVDYTAIANLVDAMGLSLSASETAYGRAYNITNGDPVRFWEILETLMRKLDLGDIPGSVPYPVAYGAGFVVESIARLRGVEPQLSRLGAAVAAKSMTMSIARAREHLGYVPRQTNEEMLDEFVSWYREEGHALL